MKIHQAPSYDRFNLFDMEKQSTASEKMQTMPDGGKTRAVDIIISDEGKDALRSQLEKVKPEVAEAVAYDLTIEDTNEVEMEHYFAMSEVSGLTLKDGNYTLVDVMQSMAETYEARYNEIVKAHENGDRQVSYMLTGENSLTLEQDLAGLERAYRRRLNDMEGYITCQQTNDGAAFFRRTNRTTPQPKTRNTARPPFPLWSRQKSGFSNCGKSRTIKRGQQKRSCGILSTVIRIFWRIRGNSL